MTRAATWESVCVPAPLLALPSITLAGWLLLVLAALLIGFSKTAIAGVGSIAVALTALALPARESTGAVLPMLIFGDLLAIALYRRHADWAVIWRLLPGLLPGLAIGWLFMRWADDTVMRTSIGLILLVMVALQLWQRRANQGGQNQSGQNQSGAAQFPGDAVGSPGLSRALATGVVGAAAGFTTMTANSSGPIITIYLILAGLSMLRMLGTMAWFFFLVNLIKVPFSIQLGLITPASLVLNLWLLPAIGVGGWLGARLIKRMDQRQFELAALALSAVAATLLLV